MPEEVKRIRFSDPKYREVYNLYRVKKMKKDANRRASSDIKRDSENKRSLRDPLKIGELVLILAERLRKKVLEEDCAKGKQPFSLHEILRER